MSTPVAWPILLEAGLRGLGLRPADFWALTPIELQLMLGQGSAAMPLARDRLDELLRSYPDKME